MEIHEETWRVARVRVRRQAEEEEGILTRVEQEVERDARIVADTTGMPTWSGGPHSLCCAAVLSSIKSEHNDTVSTQHFFAASQFSGGKKK